MVTRERSKPVYGKVVHPDHQYREIDRKDPEHQNEDGMGIVVKVVGRTGPGFPGLAKRTGASSDLN